MIKSYKYNDTSNLSDHFRVSEFKCKCGKNHDIMIDSNLVPLLEKVRSKLNASACNIYSGYRCPSHNKAVGSSSTSGYSHSGYAVDCYFLDQNGKRIPSKTVCLALEDLGHKYGIGYRCGGSANSTGNTHIDVKPRKWFGDESKSMSKSCCNSFYTYFGVSKPQKNTSGTQTSEKSLTLTTNVYGRVGGYGFSKSKVLYKKGTVIKNVTMNVGKANNYEWLKGYVNNQLRYFPYMKNWYK